MSGGGGQRFSGKQKLAILKESEKTGVKTVCAKYKISGQTYRGWRYKGPRDQASEALLLKKEAQDSGRRRSGRYLPDLHRLPH
jgi:Transposase